MNAPDQPGFRGPSAGIQPDALVLCIRDPEGDPAGLPLDRPIRGGIYVVERVYAAPYGHGVQLRGLNPAPYAGYFLRRVGKQGIRHYFAPIDRDSFAKAAALYSAHDRNDTRLGA